MNPEGASFGCAIVFQQGVFMKSESFQKLKRKVEEELKLTDENVMAKSIQLSNFHNQIRSLYVKELHILKNKAAEKDKIYGELYHKYKYNFDYTLDTKGEVEAYIKSDDIYYQTALQYAQQEIQVKYLEETLNHINNMGFRIKNYIDLQKMKLGLM